MEALKPCPFGGKQPELRDFSHRNDPDYWQAECVCCRPSVHSPAGERAQVIAAWNRRPIERAYRSLIADLYPLALIYATEYARDHGFPDGKLHPVHQKIVDAAKAVADEVLQ